MPGGDVKVVHRLGDVQVSVGVKAIDELTAAVPEIAFDFEIDREVEAKGVFVAQAAAELLAHGGITHVSDVADHASNGESTGRWLAIVVVAVIPIGIGHDGLPADFVERDLLGAMA